MKKNQMIDQFNDMVVMAEDKKIKKGNGMNAVFKLMSDTIDFNDKIESAAEAQDSAEIKAKIEQHVGTIESLYADLVEIAAGAIRSIKGGSEMEPEPEAKKPSASPAMVNAPTVPKF